MPLRAQYEKIIRDAAESGIGNAAAFWHLTPEDIRLTITAHGAAHTRAQEQMDLLAWMIGGYVATGVNAPRKYPRKPNRIRRREENNTMTESDMLSALCAFAARHNTTEVERGGGDDAGNAAN